MLHVRQADVLDGGAEFFQLLDHGQYGVSDARVQAGAEVFLRQADAQAGQRLAQGGQVIVDRLVDAGGVLRVESGDGAQHQGAVLGGVGQRAALVEAGGVGDHAPAGNPAVSGLDAGEVGEGGRLADRAAGVGAGGGGHQARGHGCGGAAGGAAGYVLEAPGVLHRAVMAGFVGGAHGELVHVQLAEADGAGGLEAGDHGGVVGRLEAAEDLRTTAGQHAFGAEQVLMGDGGAEQGAMLTGGTPRVGCLGLFDGRFVGDADKAVQLRIELVDARQQGAGQLFGGEFLGGEAAGDLGEGQLMHGEPFPYSMTLGTR
ncbi:hypothetical protein D3C85_790370 [compost metagenome]